MTRQPNLKRSERGATIVEFAIVAPVMLLLIMMMGELCYRHYVQAILTGSMAKAGRDSAIEGGGTEPTRSISP